MRLFYEKEDDDMRTQLQLQGIVFILFGVLLVLIAMVDPVLSDGILRIVADLVALIMGILGVALSLSKDHSGK